MSNLVLVRDEGPVRWLTLNRPDVRNALSAELVDALRAELTLFGVAELGERRSIESATADDAQLRFDEGVYSALLTLDLALLSSFQRPSRSA